MGVEDLVGIDWVFTFHERPLWAPPNTIIHSRFYADNTCVPTTQQRTAVGAQRIICLGLLPALLTFLTSRCAGAQVLVRLPPGEPGWPLHVAVAGGWHAAGA